MQFLIELMVVKRQTPNTVHSFHAWASCSVFRLKTIKIIKPRLKSSPFHIGFSSELSRCERVGYLFRCSHCWSLRAAIHHQSTPQRSSWCVSPHPCPTYTTLRLSKIVILLWNALTIISLGFGVFAFFSSSRLLTFSPTSFSFPVHAHKFSS